MANKNNTAPDVKDNAAAKNTNTNTTENAAPVFAPLSAVEIVERSAVWIKKYGTISAIRADYAAIVAEIGKDNFAAVLKNAQTIRTTEIENARAAMEKDVFTFSGISAAVFAAVAKSAGYVELCKYARREYAGTDAERAAAVIRDYFAAVDETGAPLCKVSHVSPDATQILTTFERRALTFNNAVSILKSSLDGMAAAAKNAATRKTGNDNAAAVRKNARAVGRVVSVYAAAVDEIGHVSHGERRDTSKDDKTKKNAAPYMGETLPVGYVPVSVYNAAVNGNETAAAAVDAAHAAAKDAAAAAGHAAIVK